MQNIQLKNRPRESSASPPGFSTVFIDTDRSTGDFYFGRNGEYYSDTDKLCYEASYVGYCLQRDLISNDIHCDIVSPSSIPSPRGKAIKTDRIDAGYLAQFYANDLLTIVQPPDEEQERDRDLLRSRQKVIDKRNQLRRHVQVCYAATACITKPRRNTNHTGQSTTTSGRYSASFSVAGQGT